MEDNLLVRYTNVYSLSYWKIESSIIDFVTILERLGGRWDKRIYYPEEHIEYFMDTPCIQLGPDVHLLEIDPINKVIKLKWKP